MELQPSQRSSTSRPRLPVRGGRSIALAAVVALAVLLPALGPATVHGQAPTCVSEGEPNDAPETAVAIVAPGCLDGTLPAGDQDIWTWDLSAADAAMPWTSPSAASWPPSRHCPWCPSSPTPE